MIGTINLDYFLKIAHIGVIFIGTIVVGVIALYLKHIKGAHIKILSQNPILKVADRYYITAVNNGLKTGILFEINVKVGYMDINDLFKNKEEGINKPFTIEAGKFEQIYFKLSEDQSEKVKNNKGFKVKIEYNTLHGNRIKKKIMTTTIKI